MREPLGAFFTIKDNFIRYVKTAFHTNSVSVEEERENLLNQDKVLYRNPWIEPLPEYKNIGKLIKDLTEEELPGMSHSQIETFKGLVGAGLAPGDFKPYLHQVEMLREALSGKHCIITSGTGSGKTESFLLPLFAQLSKELSSWSAPNRKGPNTDSWWRDGLSEEEIVDAGNGFILAPEVQQRAHETRPQAMRAMILYPMNALVEDQMTRLRTALDSDGARRWLGENLSGNSITFGRYNGATPVAGKLERLNNQGDQVINEYKVNSLIDELQVIDRTSRDVQDYIDRETRLGNEVDETELKSFFPRLDGAEMRCRFDMQIAPPDILITNFSMLSIMLMREVDSPVFERTRAWLACEDLPQEKREGEKANRVFHLIIDELHLYRGTQGTEVAYLLKLVLKRLGLSPSHSQLRILASSASLDPSNDKSLQYVSDFFGFLGVEDVKSKFRIIPGDHVETRSLNGDEPPLPLQPFESIAGAFETSGKDINSGEFIQACIDAGNFLANAFHTGTPETASLSGLLELLLHPAVKLRERLFNACLVRSGGETQHRPVCTFRSPGDNNPEGFPYFFESLFGSLDPGRLLEAGKGLLICRSLFDEGSNKDLFEKHKTSLPRFRFHYFFRNIEGLWASTHFNDGNERTVGTLYPASRIKTEEGHRVLEVLYCDNCGTLFFGGQRSLPGDPHNYCELVAVSPNIEGIPEKTPAKFVENRSYQEFGVFWPQGSQDFTPHDPPPNGYWRQLLINNALTSTHFSGEWVEAYLNKFSGGVSPERLDVTDKPENWIKGYFFRVTRDSDGTDVADPDPDILANRDQFGNLIHTHKGLPCVCPGCGANEQHKPKGSPVRGFRTGFAKTTQLFAKELVYQLPDSLKQRKLIVFSDSREDAARISDGIERNHFTDLLREILVKELHDNLLRKYLIAEAFHAGQPADSIEQDYADYPEQFDEVNLLVSDSKIDAGERSAKKQQRRREAIQKLQEIRERIIKTGDLIHLMNSDECAPVIRNFISLGVNPGGPSISLQNIPGTDIPWFNVFDFSQFKWVRNNRDFQDQIQRGTYVRLASMFFGTLFYSLESSGLGYLTINSQADVVGRKSRELGMAQQVFVEVLNSSIRILGHKYKYFPTDYSTGNLLDTNNYSSPSFPALFKKYIRSAARLHSLDDNDLGTAVLNTLVELGVLTNLGISLEELYIKVAAPDDRVWIDSRSKRPHLHRSAGISTLYPETTVLPNQHQLLCRDLWRNNYLSFHAAIEKRKPIRLHCEELTGQTDDQFKRQRYFRNVLLQNDGEPLVQTIDVLSVTTTLEVGVDIGSLQAVMLANMPPQRFNYQQRVGRSGRRGHAYSVVLTFCRGRSHDEFYFNHPSKITGDPPPVPFLTMNQQRITKRLLAKEVLRQAFLPLAGAIRLDLLLLDRRERQGSVHGEFGKTDQWSGYRGAAVNWIQRNQPEIERIIEALKPGISGNEKNELLAWVTSQNNDGLLARVDSIIDNEEIATIDISEKLAEGGVLPMFGMPTSVRNLYHEITLRDGNHGLKSIDRNVDLAIYEFAPGSQKTKDKAVHTSVGFTDDYMVSNRGWTVPVSVDGLPFYNERWMIRCKNCGFIRTCSEASELPADRLCEACGEQLEEPENIFQIKSPKAYRTNLTKGKDSKEDSDVILSRPPILAESNAEDSLQEELPENGNLNLIATLRDRDVSWRVNTNNDLFFTGQMSRTGNVYPFNPGRSFTFNDQWISTGAGDYPDPQNPEERRTGLSFRSWPRVPQPETIALAAHKNTEILRIRPLEVPDALNLDMFNQSSISFAGVRSGFYSAAFLLQRVLAARLDIDPAEVEIADIKRITTPGERVSAEIILTDELPNGSGFVRYLFNNLPEIIQECTTRQTGLSYLATIHSDEHKGRCKDACYDCLKVFRNMNYHGLLDWRLGVALLRVLSDPGYIAGADGNFNNIELDGWMEDAILLRDNFARSFDFEVLDNPGAPPVLVSGNRHYYVIITHPFWNCFVNPDSGIPSVPDGTWLAEGVFPIWQQAQQNGGEVKFIDTFNLQRRPGWCYHKLFAR